MNWKTTKEVIFELLARNYCRKQPDAFKYIGHYPDEESARSAIPVGLIPTRTDTEACILGVRRPSHAIDYYRFHSERLPQYKMMKMLGLPGDDRPVVIATYRGLKRK